MIGYRTATGIDGSALADDARNPYHVLGLKKGASEAQIREAYKVLARKHHPDKNPNDPGAMQRFIQVKEAYEALIERKTSSSQIAVTMEEKGADLQRRGVFRSIALGIGVVVLLSAGAAGGWFFWWKDRDLRVGMAAAAAGRLDEAERLLLPHVRAGGPEARTARDALLASLIAQQGRTRTGPPVEERALAVLEGATDGRALALRGDLLLALGRPAEARAAWVEARRADPSSEFVARQYAGLLAADDPATAAKLVPPLRGGRPDPDRWLRWMQGVAALRAERYDEAEACFDGDDPVSAANRAAVAIARISLGAEAQSAALENDVLAEAIRLLVEAEKVVAAVEPESPRFGFPSVEPELFDERGLRWRPVLDGEDPRAALMLVRVHALLVPGHERLREAVELAHAVAEARQEAIPPRVLLGRLRIRVGHYDEAAKIFTLLARRPSPAAQALGQAGTALVLGSQDRDGASTIGDLRAAELAAWRAAIKLEPRNPDWPYGLARTYARRGMHRDRIAADRHALKIDPRHGLAQIDLGDAMRTTRQERAALEEFARATRIPEVAGEGWLRIGLIHYDARRWRPARQALENATRLARRRAAAEAWFRLACVHSIARQKGPALDALANLQLLGADVDRFDVENEPALQWIRPWLAELAARRLEIEQARVDARQAAVKAFLERRRDGAPGAVAP